MERRKWISEEKYKDGLALAQLAPGPLAAQLGIYLGYVHYKIAGATLCGLAFILPSFIMVVAIGIAYKIFGGLPWMQAIFYGVGAAVVGLVAISSFRLTEKSISKISINAIAQKWLLWMFFLLAAVITVITQQEEVLLFVAGGILYMLVKAPPKWFRKPSVTNTVMLFGLGFSEYGLETLGKKHGKHPGIKAFVDGISAAVIGSLAGSVIVIACRTIKDVPTALMALATIVVLLKFKKIKEPQVILVAALIGLLINLIS